jgi:hypothetical protein
LPTDLFGRDTKSQQQRKIAFGGDRDEQPSAATKNLGS